LITDFVFFSGAKMMKLTKEVTFLDLAIPAGTPIPDSKITKLPKEGGKAFFTVKDYLHKILTGEILPQKHNRGQRKYSKETSNAIVNIGLNPDVLGDCVVGYPTDEWCDAEGYGPGDPRRRIAHLTGFHSRTHGIIRRFLNGELDAKDMRAPLTLTMTDGRDGSFELAYRQQGMGGQEHRTKDRITNPHLAIGEWWNHLNEKLGPVISKKLANRTSTIGTIIQAVALKHADWDWESVYRCRGANRDLSNEPSGTIKISDSDMAALVSAITYWFVLYSQVKKYCKNVLVEKFMCNAGVIGFIVTDRFSASRSWCKISDDKGNLVVKSKPICRNNTELLATVISENIGLLGTVGTDLCKEPVRARPAIENATMIFNKKAQDKDYPSRFSVVPKSLAHPDGIYEGFTLDQIKEVNQLPASERESKYRLWMTEEQAAISIKTLDIWPNGKTPHIDIRFKADKIGRLTRFYVV
jgi:hypothetical protein